MFFFPVKIDFPSVKKNTKSAREKEKTHPWKKNEKKSVRENRKVPVKKQKSDQKCPWKPKIVREKSEKSVRERGVAFREKNRKKAKNGFHGHFWFSRGKTKTLAVGGWVDGWWFFTPLDFL